MAAAVLCLLIASLLLRLCCALEFNSSGANSVKFPDSPADKLFTQITTDLHRFTKTGIHLDMIEQPYCSEREPSFRVQILSGQVYIAGEVIDWHNTQSRNRNVKLQLLDVAQHYRLPDVDFLLLTGDWPPEDRSGQSTGCPLQGPVFMQTKQRRHDHVLLHPDHTFTDWNEANTPGWYQQQYLLAEAARAVPWGQKVGKLFFAGNIDTGNRHIMRDVDMNPYPEFDIRVWNWKDPNSPMKFVKLPEHCKYKYLLNWPGNTYSARLKTLLLCNSTVVHSQIGGWVEFWYHTLEHGKNIVLTKGIEQTGDVTNKMHKVVKKLVANEKTAMRIAAAGADLAQNILSVENVREYWYRLIVSYSKLQRFEVERHPDSVSLGESLTGPVIWRFEDRTCKMCHQSTFK